MRTRFIIPAAVLAALALSACGQAGAAEKGSAQVRLPQFLGCYKDQSNGQSELGGRDLNGIRLPDDQKMTTQSCTAACKAKGFKYAGLQSSSSCFCGNEYGRTGKSAGCTSICAGNPGQTCGGNWANSVYRVK